ncbi:uncharacterized protein LOC128218784 isoform X2 [Mya arenaria]|uniref:uncharacterized protein LOC128218784 isoform X2 n=1 Tax=Mya arenaria TaxID=6604 RepID=UPI0022E56D01|nr:uncharacterized protein LOC128218784 isoform X2 [Mya arenaria]
MEAIYHVICAVLLLVFSYVTEGFRVRRAGVAGYDDPYGLTNAFSDIDTRSDYDYRTLLRKRVLEDDESYFNPKEDGIEYLQAGSYIPNREIAYIPDYLLDKSYIGNGPMEYGGLNGRIYGPQKRTTHNSHRVVPTMEELRTIFGEANVPMKKLAPVKRQEPKQNTVTKESRDYSYNKHEDKANFDKENRVNAFKKLLSAAEEMHPNTNIAGESVHSKSKSEVADDLGEVFKDAKTGVDSEERTEDVQNSTEDQNDEVVLESTAPVNTITDDNAQYSKSKRASDGLSTIQPGYIINLLEDIAELKEKVSKLEILQMLEERENDYLASALKFATLDQIQDSDVFVDKEYDDISKATDTETLIQNLTDDDDSEGLDEQGVIETLGEDLQSPLPDDIVGEETKRSDIPNIPSGPNDEWYDTPVREGVGLGAILEDPTDDEGTDLNGLDSRLILPFPDDHEEGDAVAMETPPQYSENTKQGDRNILATLLANLSPSTVNNIISDLQQETAPDVCPAVLELSQNCAFADVEGIPIDDDARNLCVRHQLCYTCGSVFEMPRQGCDHGYKVTVTEACEGDSACLRDGAYFLRLMEKFHHFLPTSPEECQMPCVEDFILGVD